METECKPILVKLSILKKLKATVEKQALEAARMQGLDKHERLKQEGDFYQGDLLGLAMHSCSFYQCFEC